MFSRFISPKMYESINMNSLETVLVFWLMLKLITVNSTEENLSRQERTPFWYPYQSGIGFAVALAIPLDNGRADVFLSFCIGTGPGVPELTNPDTPGLSPPVFTTIYEDTLNGRKLSGTVPTNSTEMKQIKKTKRKEKRKIRNSFLTRRKFYRLFAANLKQNGFDSHYCLLKAICETAQHNFGYRNGVLGDIIHIMFTPTSSKDEQLDTIYYEAEANGHQHLCDTKYGSRCPISVFDLITIIK